MSKWSEHVKKFAKKNKMNYREASMNEKCKKSYQRKKNMKSKKMNGAVSSILIPQETIPVEEKLRMLYFDEERAREAIEKLGGSEGVLGESFVSEGKKLRGGRVEFDDVQGCIALILIAYIEKFGHEISPDMIQIIRTNAVIVCGLLKQIRSIKQYRDSGDLSLEEATIQIDETKDKILLTLLKIDNKLDIEMSGGDERVTEGVLESLKTPDTLRPGFRDN